MKFLFNCFALVAFTLAIVVLTSHPNAQVGTPYTTQAPTPTPDPSKPSLLVRNVQVREGNSGRTTVTLEMFLTLKPTQPLSIAYATMDGTASRATDYGAISGTLNFSPGQNRAYLSFLVNGDTEIEDNEHLFVNFTSRAINAGGSSAIVSIINDDRVVPTATPIPVASPTPRPNTEIWVGIDASNSRVVEGNAGQKFLAIPVYGYSNLGDKYSLTFSYTTLNGTAVAGRDFVYTAGHNRVITSGRIPDSTTTIYVPIIGDKVFENDETFTFRVFNAQGRFRETERTFTIVNDDQAPVTPSGGRS